MYNPKGIRFTVPEFRNVLEKRSIFYYKYAPKHGGFRVQR